MDFQKIQNVIYCRYLFDKRNIFNIKYKVNVMVAGQLMRVRAVQ